MAPIVAKARNAISQSTPLHPMTITRSPFFMPRAKNPHATASVFNIHKRQLICATYTYTYF